MELVHHMQLDGLRAAAQQTGHQAGHQAQKRLAEMHIAACEQAVPGSTRQMRRMRLSVYGGRLERLERLERLVVTCPTFPWLLLRTELLTRL